ncbi:MAG: hypothetical protein OXG35_12705 [Acidobacteria bacterium]|nr:hypothetical protein [Acidobacteriota bacterium]
MESLLTYAGIRGASDRHRRSANGRAAKLVAEVSEMDPIVLRRGLAECTVFVEYLTTIVRYSTIGGASCPSDDGEG